MKMNKDIKNHLHCTDFSELVDNIDDSLLHRAFPVDAGPWLWLCHFGGALEFVPQNHPAPQAP
jgi:hypothetical protein